MHIKPAFFLVILSVACSGIDTPDAHPPDGYGGAILSTGARGGAPTSHGGSCGNSCSRGGTSGSSAGGRALGGSTQDPADSSSEGGAGLANAGTSASNGGAGSGSSAGSSKGAGGAGKSPGAGGKPAFAAGGSAAGGKGSAGTGGTGGTGGRPGSELGRGGGANIASGGGANTASGGGANIASGGGANTASGGGANTASGGDSANVAAGGTLGSNSSGGSTNSSGGPYGDGSADEATPFFSEYVEGSGSFKALEIAATAGRDLSGCHLEIYANGAIKAWRTIELSGSVSREQVVVLCSPELAAVLPACLPSGALSFTGNDALVLSCSGTVVDAFGQIGNDPMGSGWGAPNGRTSDVTLRRFCEVEHGDTEPNDAFDPALEWSQAPLDSFEDLGVFCAAP